jgi:hypothetical protein
MKGLGGRGRCPLCRLEESVIPILLKRSETQELERNIFRKEVVEFK